MSKQKLRGRNKLLNGAYEAIWSKRTGLELQEKQRGRKREHGAHESPRDGEQPVGRAAWASRFQSTWGFIWRWPESLCPFQPVLINYHITHRQRCFLGSRAPATCTGVPPHLILSTKPHAPHAISRLGPKRFMPMPKEGAWPKGQGHQWRRKTKGYLMKTKCRICPSI